MTRVHSILFATLLFCPWLFADDNAAMRANQIAVIGARGAEQFYDKTLTVTGRVAHVTIRPTFVLLKMDEPHANDSPADVQAIENAIAGLLKGARLDHKPQMVDRDEYRLAMLNLSQAVANLSYFASSLEASPVPANFVPMYPNYETAWTNFLASFGHLHSRDNRVKAMMLYYDAAGWYPNAPTEEHDWRKLNQSIPWQLSEIESDDQGYPTSPFTGVIFSPYTNVFNDLSKLEGKNVEITGKIENYKEKPVIVLTNAAQLNIVEPGGGGNKSLDAMKLYPAMKDEATVPSTAQTVRGGDLPYTVTLPDGWMLKRKTQDFDILASHGSLYVGVIAEEASLGTPETVAKIARDRLREVATDLSWSEPSTLLLDARSWVQFVAQCKVDEIPVTYQFYVYSGSEGTVQIVGWTTQNLYSRDSGLMRDVMRTFKFSR